MKFKKFCLLILLMLIVFSVTVIVGMSEDKKINFPERPIELIIVWSAGGGTDLSTRLIGDYAARELGQPFIYLNVTGANGAIGWGQAAQAKPDGYTVAGLTLDVLTNEALGQTPIGYRDFDLLCQFTVQPIGVFVPEKSPYNSLEDLLTAAKENPNTISMGTTPLGGFFHQGAALLENTSDGAKFNIIPYKGSAEIIAALAGGNVDSGIQTLTGMEQYIETGNMRLLAILTEDRLENFPDIPTAKELGYDVIHESWRGFAVPKGTPDDVKEKLVDSFEKAFNNPEFQEKAKKAKIDLYYNGPEKFKASLDRQFPNIKNILKQLGFVK